MRLMGIINSTPDSFYEGGRDSSVDSAIRHALQMVDEGADLIDIGGESARPGSLPISESEELERVLPVIAALQVQIPISIDTTKPAVARQALAAGATLINDINGFRNPEMVEVAAESGAELCLMHMLGTPKTMQLTPHYPEGLIPTLLHFFEIQVEKLVKQGVHPKQIILDPGIGFGKTVDHCVEIILNIPILKSLGFPVLIGLSRKSFISKIVGKPASELLSATIALNTIALRAGADLIRVHDVREHRELIDLISYLGKRGGG